MAFICLKHNTTAFLEISLNLLDGIWCVNVIKMKFFLNKWPCSYFWAKIFMSIFPNTVSVETVYIIKCTCGMFISFVNSCLCIQIFLLKIQALNIPVDACYIKTECKSLVVQVLRCWCINHAKHRAAALTEEICDQAAAGTFQETWAQLNPNQTAKCYTFNLTSYKTVQIGSGGGSFLTREFFCLLHTDESRLQSRHCQWPLRPKHHKCQHHNAALSSCGPNSKCSSWMCGVALLSYSDYESIDQMTWKLLSFSYLHMHSE